MNFPKSRVLTARTFGMLAAGATALTLVYAPAAHAQGGFGGGGQRAGFGGGQFGRRGMPELTLVNLPADAIVKRLGLSAEQKERIDKIVKPIEEQRTSLQTSRDEMMKQFQAARNGGGDPQAMREQMQPLMQKMQETQQNLQTAEEGGGRDIDQVLTLEQREKGRALVKDATLLRNAGLPYQVIGDVVLTDEQRDKLNKFREDNQREDAKRMEEMRNNPNGDRQAMMKEMQDLREKRHKAALALLTPEQKAVVEAYEKAHPQPQGFGFGGGGFGGGGRRNRGGGNNN